MNSRRFKKMQGIQIHEINEAMYQDLGRLVGWKETTLQPGQAVEAHRHGFNAMYFTNGVSELYCEGERVALPEKAAVFIAQGREHAWNGVREGCDKGVVGHFHSGHGIHKIVDQYN